MSILKNLTKQIAAATLLTAAIVAPQLASAATKIRVQSVIPTTADEVVMLQDFANDVRPSPTAKS